MSAGKDGLRTALVVLGMHRSGTSAMARVLSLSGAQLPNDLYPAGPDNERGFWESKSVIQLDEEILDGVDSGWDDIFAGRPRRYLSNFDRVFRHKAEAVLASAYSDAELIVLKDPRINVLSGFWDSALRAQGYEPIYVTMVRNPLEVAASLRERNKIPTEQGLLMWLDHMLAAERDTRHAKRLFVSYDDLLHDWRVCLDRVERTAGIPLPRRTSTASNAIERFLSPSLKHQRFLETEVRDVEDLRGIAFQAYAWFNAAAHEQEPVDPAVLDRVREYLATLHDRVGPIVADYRTQLAAFRKHAYGLEELVGHLRGELGTSQAKYDSTENEYQTALAELAEFRKHATGLEALVEHLRGELDTSQAKYDSTEKEYQTALAELAEFRKHAKGLEGLVEHLRDELGTSQAKYDSTEKEYQTALAELAEFREHAKGLEELVEHLRDELRTSQAKYEHTAHEHQAALAASAEYRAHAVSLEELVGHLRRELSASQAKYEDAAIEHQARFAELADARTQGANALEQLRVADAARQLAERDAKDLAARHVELRAEVYRLQATAESALARSRTMERELAEAAADRRARERLTAELEATKDRLTLDLEDARQQIVMAERNSAALSDQILALGAQVANAEYAQIEADRAHKIAEERRSAADAEARALQQQRDEIFQSTTWKLTTLPRRLLSKLRGG